MQIFLTGGTGFLGGYVAEACAEQGHQVRALAQPCCDTQLLQELGAEVLCGDLCDPPSFRDSLAGCDLLIHTAAKVGDWGRWEDFRAANIEAVQNLYEAAVKAGVPRAVHLSSTAVYGKDLMQQGPVDESMGPLPVDQLPKWYYYGRSKVIGETLAMDYHRRGRIQVSVIRPGWVYGPRDDARLGKLLTMLRQGKVRSIGDGSNILMLTYAANVADAILLAGTHQSAVGEAFNVSNDEEVTQRQYLDALADMLGVPPVQKTVPFRNAYLIATGLESTYRLLRIKQRPVITRQSVSLIGLSHVFSSSKIRQWLGWAPKVNFETAIERIRAWWMNEQASLVPTSHDAT